MTQQQPANPATSLAGLWQRENDINWRFWLGVLLQGRWWLAGALVVGVLAGLVHGRLATPIFESDTLIQFEKNQTMNASVNMAGALQEERTVTATEIQILKSRRVLGMTVTELALDVTVKPRTLPLIGSWLTRGYAPGDLSASGIPGLSAFARGGEVLEVASLEVPEDWLWSQIRLEALSSTTYRLHFPDGGLSAPLAVGRGVLLKLSGAREFTIFVRRLAARPGMQFLLTKIPLDVAIAELRAGLSITERDRGTELIDVRFRHPDPREAQRILSGIASNYLRQNVERKSAEANQTLAFLERQLPELKKELEAAEGAFNSFRSANRTLNVTAEGAGLLQRSVETQTALGLLQQRRQELLQRVTEEHPSVQAIDRQISALRGQSSAAESEVGRLPALEQRMLQLMRDVEVNNDLYIGLLNSAQELKVAKAGTVGNARIVDMASLPRGTVLPNRQKLLLLYVLSSLLLTIGGLVLLQLLRPGVKEAKDIEQALGLPVYATVPRSEESVKGGAGRDRDHKRGLVALHDPQDPATESLRSLRTALQFANLDASNNAILIAGPAPGVGKSFISANLAAVLAQTGKRTILVDADMRRGHLQDMFGIAGRERGLSDYLAGELSLEQVINRDTGVEGLALITTGAIPPNPSELLLHPRFDVLVRELCAAFDHVIFDAGPLLAVTDSAIIGRAAGCTLLVARYQQTPLRELELAAQRLVQAGITLRGVVFNDVQKHGAYGYGYGYGYQYSYSYRSKENSKS